MAQEEEEDIGYVCRLYLVLFRVGWVLQGVFVGYMMYGHIVCGGPS